MTPEPKFFDDQILGRVAAVGPQFADADLDPRQPEARRVRLRAMAATPERAVRTQARRVRRVGVLAIAVAGVAALALVLAGVLRGPAGTGTQPAAAAIVTHVERELATRPGTIVVQRSTSTLQAPHKPVSRHSGYGVIEAVPNSTVQNYLSDTPNGVVSASINGDEEMYLPQTDTIYISNPFTSYIHPGPRAGTYVYRPGRGSPTPAFSGAITLTASEVKSVESGHTTLLPHQLPDGRFKLEIHTLPREPATEAEQIRDQLNHHQLHFDGRDTLNGHSVYRFVDERPNQDSQARLYVDTSTYAPIKSVARVSGNANAQSTTVWTEYKVLPITAHNDRLLIARLLSIKALHPSARIDRSHTDFLRAQRGLIAILQHIKRG